MSANEDIPWVCVVDVCAMYGYTPRSAVKKIYDGTFPVKTYKVGNHHVIDKVVHETYFLRQREAGLRALDSTPG